MKWAGTNNSQQGTFSEAAAFGDVVFNCTMGIFSLDALKLAGEENLRNKILIDVANPLDFSRGMPPRLTIGIDNSLGEEIQTLLPETKVVKALNTVNHELMVNPGKVNAGNIDLFICGNDEAAKITVTELLVKEFGWKRECVLDMGEIKHARSTESMLLFIISLTMKYGSFNNGIKVHRG
jgi:predicted dinucleotide-binding enzyme